MSIVETLRELIKQRKDIFVEIVLEMIQREVQDIEFKEFLAKSWRSRYYTKESCKTIDAIKMQALNKQQELALDKQFMKSDLMSPSSSNINDPRLEKAEVHPFIQIQVEKMEDFESPDKQAK